MAETVIKLGDPEKMKRTIIRKAVKAAKIEAMEEIKKTLAARIDKAIQSELQATVASNVTALVRTAMERPIQKTDDYGNPKGEAKTFHEHLIDETKRILTEGKAEIDYQGRLTLSSRERGYGESTTAAVIVRY